MSRLGAHRFGAQEFRFALRRLAHTPGLSLAAIGMLALGIGLSVAMYCTLNGVLLRSLPLHDSEAVVVLEAHNPSQQIDSAQFSVTEAESLAAGTPGFAAIGYYWWYGVSVFDGNVAREITTHMVGPGYFATLGVVPVLGRVLSDEDIRQDRPFALLSHAEWQRSFGGDPAVIGKRLDLIGSDLAQSDPLEVIGVLPADVDVIAGETGLWRPLSPRWLPTDPKQRATRALLMIGRLADGVDIEKANAALQARFASLEEADGSVDSGWSARTRPLLDLLVGDVRLALWGAFVLAALVLLIAAANVAILLDARQATRLRELAVMQAIGASRARLRRELLIEVAVLAAIAAVIGMAIAYGSIELLRDLAVDSIPLVDGIVLDSRVFAFAVTLALAVPLLSTLFGSLRLRAVPADAMRAGGRGVIGHSAQRRSLPALAMALSTLSLVVAFSVVGGLWRLQGVDPGYRAEQVHALQFFRGGNEAFIPFTERLLERLAALPGAADVALTSAAPLSSIGSASVEVRVADGDESLVTQSGLRRVSTGYRALLNIPLLGGREFDANDRVRAPNVALINQTAAQRLFAGRDPVGQRIRLPITGPELTEVEIVGVVADIRNDGLRAPASAEVLLPFAQHPRAAMTFLLRTDSKLPGIATQMASALHALDPRQAITRQFVLADELAAQLRPARFFARLVGAFAGVAALLAMLGIYAVTSLQQRRRIGEFGLRLAVGASPRHLASRVLRDSAQISAVGVLIGAAVAFILLRSLDMDGLGIEGGVSALAVLAGLLAMTVAGLAAAAIPALRAARTDPLEALRHD